MRYSIVATCILFLFAAYNAHASDIWILDCQGNPQFVQKTDGNAENVLSLKIENPQNPKLLLLSQDDKITIEGKLVNGIAQFEGVHEGTWRLCSSENTSVQATACNIGGQNESAVSLTELGLGGMAAGVAAIGFSLSGSGGSDSSDIPSGLSGQTGSVITPSSEQVRPAVSGSTSAASRGECFVGDEVIPMSPFM